MEKEGEGEKLRMEEGWRREQRENKEWSEILSAIQV